MSLDEKIDIFVPHIDEFCLDKFWKEYKDDSKINCYFKDYDAKNKHPRSYFFNLNILIIFLTSFLIYILNFEIKNFFYCLQSFKMLIKLLINSFELKLDSFNIIELFKLNI